MSQIIGHTQCYEALENMVRAYEANGYTRLVQYQAGESILMDSKPAPGYVPGVAGKDATGVGYTPAVDGTRIHLYYVAGKKPNAKAKAEASRAIRSGMDSHEILGSIVSIRRTGDGIQLMFVASNRDHIENGVITAKLAIRSVSVTREPSAKGGMIVAMGLDQSLGIPYHMLRSLLESETIEHMDVGAISAGLRAIQAGTSQHDAQVGIPTPNPAPAQGAK